MTNKKKKLLLIIIMTLKQRIEHKKYLDRIKKSLYKKYCTQDNPYKEENKDRINYVIYNVLSKQMLNKNKAELEALQILSNRGINVKYQEPIPILSKGGKLEHLYIADILIGNTIVEIDGSFHDKERQLRDLYRDELTNKAGYITKRFKTSEVSKLKEETFD